MEVRISQDADSEMFKMYGGEGGIRTPDSLATMSDFESGAFNRALPPLRLFYSLSGPGGFLPDGCNNRIGIRLHPTVQSQLS